MSVATGEKLDVSIQLFLRIKETDPHFCPEVNSTVAESLNSEAVRTILRKIYNL